MTIPDQSLVKLILDPNNGSFKTWVGNIENMLIGAGLTQVWENQSCSVVDYTFRTRLCDTTLQMKENCTDDVNSNPKLRT